MAQRLGGMEVAILLAAGFDRSNVVYARHALLAAGASVDLVAPARAWRELQSDGAIHHLGVAKVLPAEEARAEQYRALVALGGDADSNDPQLEEGTARFVREFVASRKPIGALGEGAVLLIQAGAVRSRKMTSSPRLKAELCAAGAEWVDDNVVVDGNLVTAARGAALPLFCAVLVALIAGGREQPRAGAG